MGARGGEGAGLEGRGSNVGEEKRPEESGWGEGASSLPVCRYFCFRGKGVRLLRLLSLAARGALGDSAA